jgi:type III secretion protein HrpB1
MQKAVFQQMLRVLNELKGNGILSVNSAGSELRVFLTNNGSSVQYITNRNIIVEMICYALVFKYLLISAARILISGKILLTTMMILRTHIGAVKVPAGQTKQLGTVDVSKSSNIRVVATERISSKTNTSIRLTITEGEELVAPLDVLLLTPHSSVTRVYDVAGTKLSISADAVSGTGNDAVDALVYGLEDLS